MIDIKFGTSGWRDVVGKGFIFDNVRMVVKAIAEMIKENGEADKGIIIGHDPRFMGEEFAQDSASILAGDGIKCFLCSQATPTPVIAFEILRRKVAGAINFTASHNPSEYNGIKFSSNWGGPALLETTREIERRVRDFQKGSSLSGMAIDDALKKGLVEKIDPRQAYFKRLKELVDIDAIVASKLKIAVNPLYGAGTGYLDRILRVSGVDIITLNNYCDPNFGGHPPDPAAEFMKDFISVVKNDDEIGIGLATDGDADRYGIIDSNGAFIEPNYILALLMDYLQRRRETKGDAARSVATSHFLDAVAAFHGAKVYETPVGFKYIAEFIRDDKILIGGEESAGLTLKGHVPEKDGILACLLVAEMVAVEGKSLSVLLDELYKKVGRFCTRRENIRLTDALKTSCSEKLQSPPSSIGGKVVKEIIRMDGIKLLFEDGTWMLFRESGTEPVVRAYVEAGSESELKSMMRSAVDFLTS